MSKKFPRLRRFITGTKIFSFVFFLFLGEIQGQEEPIENGVLYYQKTNNKNAPSPYSENLTPTGVITTNPTTLDYTFPSYKFISGYIINAVHSEIAGKVIIWVNRDHYSGQSDNVLIPKGTFIEATYQGDQIIIGSTRMKLDLQRIALPNGVFYHPKKSAYISDASGRAGIAGKIDYRFLERIGYPFALSLALGYATGTANTFNNEIAKQLGTKDTSSDQFFNETFIQTTTKNNNEIFKKIYKDFASLKPTITLPPGSLIKIILGDDLVFPKYKSGSDKLQNFYKAVRFQTTNP